MHITRTTPVIASTPSRDSRSSPHFGGVERDGDARRLTNMNRWSCEASARSRSWLAARLPALVGACLLLMLPLAACGSKAAASSAPGFVGYDWRVVAVSHDGTTRAIPPSLHMVLRFSPNGRFGANDGVNFHSGDFRKTGDGFTVTGMTTTLAGYAGHDATILLAINAINSFDDGVHATAKLSGDRLVIGVSSYTLTCQRLGRQTDLPSAAGTGGG